MDSALKTRLVGATVLVALAVIFLPMLVDGPEPQSGTTSVPLDIPTPPERDFETRDLPLTPPAPAPADDADRIVAVDADVAPRIDAAPEDTAVETPAESAAPKPPATEPEPTAAPSAAPTTPAPATTAPVTPAAAPATAPGTRYVVNLGSYSDVANASALVTALKGARLTAYAESIQVDGKAVRRVRLGPYAQRGEAEAARLAATRVRSDLSAAVVALDAEAASTAPAPARVPVASGFAVKIGALASQADANALRERARGAGFVAFVEKATTESGPLWRVRVGPELQRANAEKLKTQIAQKLKLDGVIVTHP